MNSSAPMPTPILHDFLSFFSSLQSDQLPVSVSHEAVRTLESALPEGLLPKDRISREGGGQLVQPWPQRLGSLGMDTAASQGRGEQERHRRAREIGCVMSYSLGPWCCPAVLPQQQKPCAFSTGLTKTMRPHLPAHFPLKTDQLHPNLRGELRTQGQ